MDGKTFFLVLGDEAYMIGVYKSLTACNYLAAFYQSAISVKFSEC